MLRFNYQRNAYSWYRETDLPEKVLQFPPSPTMVGTIGLSFVDSSQAGKINLFLRYATECYEKESMERYLELFFKAIEYLES